MNDGDAATYGGDEPAFAPRLSDDVGPAPFNPGAYFYVAFLAGAVALCIVAVMNLPRLTKVAGLGNRTYAAIAAVAAGAVAFLVLAPDDWWETARNIRFGLRGVAVVGSIALYGLHKGPAFGTMQRSGEYTSMWKALGPIIIGAIIQGIITIGLRAV